MDKDAIQAFENGTAQLSCGYSCDLDPSPGVTDKGLPYDMVQRNIVSNHIALTQLKFGDNVTAITDINQTRNGEPLPPRTVQGQTVDYYTGKPIGQPNDSEIATDGEPVLDAYEEYKRSIDTANLVRIATVGNPQRGNPWHDPETGEFTSGPGGGAAPALSGGGALNFGGGGGGLNLNIRSRLLAAAGPIDPKRNVEQLATTAKQEAAAQTFASKEAALAHAAKTHATWKLHQAAHEQALEEIKKHAKKWQKPKVTSHTATGPRQGFALSGPKSHHLTVSVDGIDAPDSSYAHEDSARAEFSPAETYGRPREHQAARASHAH